MIRLISRPFEATSLAELPLDSVRDVPAPSRFLYGNASFRRFSETALRRPHSQHPYDGFQSPAAGPASGRVSPRIPRRHRDHQRMVVVDALAVPVCGRGLAVDGEAEGLVPEDDGVGR